MQVDGRPNVRTCIEAARPGQAVRGQHAWPGLRFDLLRVFDQLSYFLPVGFYYKRFHKPRCRSIRAAKASVYCWCAT